MLKDKGMYCNNADCFAGTDTCATIYVPPSLVDNAVLISRGNLLRALRQALIVRARTRLVRRGIDRSDDVAIVAVEVDQHSSRLLVVRAAVKTLVLILPAAVYGVLCLAPAGRAASGEWTAGWVLITAPA